MNGMRNRYYFAAYSGGECICKCQGTNMTVKTSDSQTVVEYTDDDERTSQIILSANAVWIMEVD